WRPSPRRGPSAPLSARAPACRPRFPSPPPPPAPHPRGAH
ncbi:MAG: hypothetical protein AVDCRST_MAG19-1807, partial [uncultured Thermomicrobiales bacterium]